MKSLGFLVRPGKVSELARPAAYLALTTMTRALSGLVVAKLISVATGPAMFGRLSQLLIATALVGMFSGGGIGAAITRTLAAEKTGEGRDAWLRVALRIYVAATLVLAVLLGVYARELAIWVLGDPEYQSIFVILAISQALVGISNILQAVAAARGSYKFIFQVNILGAVFGIGLIVALVSGFGYAGAAIGIVAAPAMTGLFALAMGRGEGGMPARLLKDSMKGWMASRKAATHLLSYSLITLAGAGSLSLAQMATRDFVGAALGWQQVGYWQAVSRISDAYMQFISLFLMSYGLPRLAKHGSLAQARGDLFQLSTFLIASLVLGGAVLWLCRERIIALLYSAQFVEASYYILPQLLGDVFRTVAVCFSVSFMALRGPRISICYEAAQGFVLYLTTFLLIRPAGIMAPLYAHCTTYLILALVMGTLYRAHEKRGA